MATEFPEEYVATFSNRDYAPDAITASQDLHAAFRLSTMPSLLQMSHHSRPMNLKLVGKLVDRQTRLSVFEQLLDLSLSQPDLALPNGARARLGRRSSVSCLSLVDVVGSRSVQLGPLEKPLVRGVF
jgi:hypothetical protein